MICIDWLMNRYKQQIYMVFECVNFIVVVSIHNGWDWFDQKFFVFEQFTKQINFLSSQRKLFLSVTFRSESTEKDTKSFTRIWSKMIQNTVMFKCWINSNINDFHSFNLQPFDWPTFHGRAETCQSNET